MVRGRLEAHAPVAEAEEELVGHYWLRVGPREVQVRSGETLIGRGEGCHLIVSEAMVSRRHARIVLAGARPFIEDLGSANGTFVNQTRVHGFHDLFPGDRIFIGTTEIEVTRVVESERPTVPVLEEDLDRPTPSSGVSAFDLVAREQVTLPRAPGMPEVVRELREQVALEDFDAATHLADKMFTMGRTDAALKILTAPLEEILDAARRGRVPGAPLLDAVGRYAVKLANETLDGRWVDLAVEAHLIAVRPLREETIQKLAALRARAAIGDDALIGRYYEQLRDGMVSFCAADRILSERVACLLPTLDP